MDKPRLDIMVDIETLGNRNDCCIFQIAAVGFDIETGKITEFYNEKADISKTKGFINVTGETLKWWLNTDATLLTKLLNQGEMSEDELIISFNKWMTSISSLYELHFWGCGILFDNNIIRNAFEKRGLTYPVAYNKDRDVRTILEIAAKKTNQTEKEFRTSCYEEGRTIHDAYDDCLQQINIVTKAYNILTK